MDKVALAPISLPVLLFSLSVSPYPVLVLTLLLSEGQAGEACEPSHQAVLFLVPGVTAIHSDKSFYRLVASMEGGCRSKVS